MTGIIHWQHALKQAIVLTFFIVWLIPLTVSQTTITYSENHINGQQAGTQCNAWNDFRAQLTPQNYTKVTISGTFDQTGVSCTDPTVVAQLAEALNTLGAGVFESCDGNTWSICTSRYNGEVWLNPPSLCSGANCPNPGYILRPCISNSNWGGVNTQTCSAPTQIMTMEFEVDGGGGGNPNCVNGQYSDFDQQNITSTGQNFDFIFTGVPDPTGDATVTFCVEGDYGISSEFAELFDENGNLLGTNNGSGGDCSGVPSCLNFNIPLATVTMWAADGQIQFLSDNSSSVNSFCSVEYNSVEITYPCSGGGAPCTDFDETKTITITESGVHTYNFPTMTGAPAPASDGVLTVTSIADFGINSGSEHIEIFDENGASIGIHGNEPGSDCSMKTTVFNIPQATISTWAADGMIDFTGTQATFVNPLCGGPGGDEVNIQLTYTCAGGGGGNNCAVSADFESGAGGWMSGTINGNNTWGVRNVAGDGQNLGSQAFGCFNDQGFTEHSFLQSPTFSANAGDEIIFDHWQCNENGFYDREYLEISYDGGSNWNILIDYTDPIWDTQSTWETHSVTIPQSSGNTVIRFRYNTVDGCCGCDGGWFLDNITVGPPGCGDGGCPSVVQINCPADVEVECDESTDPSDTGEPTGEPSCDGGTVTFTYSDNTITGNCPAEYTIERTWTADDGMTTNSCVQTIDVVDTTPPEWDDSDGMDQIIAECNGRDDQADTIAANNVPTATDNCSDFEVTLVDEDLTTLCGGSAEHVFTFEAEDECGNVNQYFLTVIIEDTTPPQLVEEAEDITVECDGMGNLNDLNNWLATNGGAETYDRCSGTSWTNDYDPANFIPGCGNTGSVTVTFTPSDDCDNEGRSTTATFTIVDTTPPEIITEASDLTVECGEDGELENDQFFWLDNNGGAIAEEVCGDFDWTWELIDEQSECKGEISLTVEFTATDECNNSSSTIATYTIVDTRPPAIFLPFEEKTISCEEEVDWGPIYAVDECTTEIPSWTWEDDIEESECDQSYTITRTWTATDPCGNAAMATQVIHVVDDEAPELSFNSGSVFYGLQDGDTYEWECGTDLIFDEGDVDVEDNCFTGFMQVSMVDESTYSASCIESGYIEEIKWTFSAEDACGNMGTLTIYIRLVDNTPPTITIPPDMTVDCDDPVVFGPPDISDNCGSPLTVTTEDNVGTGDCEDGDLVCHTRSWTVTDFCGNMTVAQQTICQEDQGTRNMQAPDDRLDVSLRNADMNLYPNPAMSEVNILLELSQQEAGSFIVSNAHGQVVLQNETIMIEGMNKHVMDVRELEAGVYYLIWRSGNSYLSEPFVKINR